MYEMLEFFERFLGIERAERTNLINHQSSYCFLFIAETVLLSQFIWELKKPSGTLDRCHLDTSIVCHSFVSVFTQTLSVIEFQYF